MTATTAPAVVHITRRLFLGLILAAAALTAAFTWLVVSVVIDDRVVTTAPPPLVAPTVSPIAAKDRPISVADAYHGVGLALCA